MVERQSEGTISMKALLSSSGSIRFGIISLLVCASVFLSQCQHLPKYSQSSRTLRVMATLDEKSLDVTWRIENLSSEPFVLQEEGLPWDSTAGLAVSLVTELSNAPVPRKYRPSSYTSGEIVLRSGGSVEGTTTLHNWFMDIDKYRKHHGALLFLWCYWPNYLKGDTPDRYFGGCLVPTLLSKKSERTMKPKNEAEKAE